MHELDGKRAQMVAMHLARRGIEDTRVLQAFRVVPREAFLPRDLAEFAYDDTPLEIGEGQTISQPYVVAMTVAALGLRGRERVLEVGTGSGYAAAILGQLVGEVFTVERIASLADSAADRLARLGARNVYVFHGDGTLGWEEHAPYDAITVAAGGPKAPPALLSQLAIGGRLVIPIGPDEGSQVLVRITRVSATTYREERLANVRFVPLIGEHGWGDEASPAEVLAAPAGHGGGRGVATLLRETVEPLNDIATASMGSLLDRIADARVVLLGESTHGTSEFYRMRARITRELIEKRGFQFVAVEADWPDAARIDEYVLGGDRRSRHAFAPFTRFPTWMWRNEEVHALVDWLRAFNAASPRQGVGFHGLDLYSMFTSIAAVLAYLDEVDPEAARVGRMRYGRLTPWQKDPAAYGHAVLAGRYRSSEGAVVTMLREMLERRVDYARNDGERFFDAAQNARVVADAERYYRTMYYGSAASWNLRDTHMLETLQSLLTYYGGESKGIVWAHNSHIGDAAATEMSTHGEHNVGQLCREAFGEKAFIIGFGTDHGVVAAASDWDEPMDRMRVVPAIGDSFERLFHEAGLPACMLHLRRPARSAVREELTPSRLERAIGVVYRPATELASHYFSASLARQFDHYIWFDETSAVEPLPDAPQRTRSADLPDTYPFGL